MNDASPDDFVSTMPGTADNDPAASLLLAKRGYGKRVALLATIAVGAIASAIFTLFAAVQSLRVVLTAPDASAVAQTVAALLAVAATVCAAMIAVSELKIARADKSRWYKRDGGMYSF